MIHIPTNKNKNTNMKATNDGTCQICGCRQRLPGGTLAAHGYTTKWGFFSGVCTGSHSKPFEQSIDLIENAITSQLAQIDGLRLEASLLRDAQNERNTGNKAWYSVYTDHGYVWQQVQVVDQRAAGSEYADFRALEVKAPQNRLSSSFGYAKTIAEIVFKMNERKAVAIDREIQQREGWISWQRARIKNWKPAPLLPRGDGKAVAA